MILLNGLFDAKLRLATMQAISDAEQLRQSDNKENLI
jgi:hypothetical protein